MLSKKRKAAITIEAGMLFGKCLRVSQDKAQAYVDPVDLLPNLLEIAARDVLGLELVEQDQVPNLSTHAPDVRTTGLYDSERSRIFVPSLKSNETRFSLAHEIGHAVLKHEGLCYRERSRTGRPFASSQDRDREEDANCFAAKFLMPAELLAASFLERFGSRIARDEIDDNTAYSLTGGRVGPSSLRQMRLLELAQLFARSKWFNGRSFESLCEKFRVSPEALAQELIDLELLSLMRRGDGKWLEA